MKSLMNISDELKLKLTELSAQEIREQLLGVTQQYLSVLKVVFEDEHPKLEYIDRHQDVTRLYFEVVDEHFFFTTYFKTEPEIELISVEITPASSITLSVSSYELPLENILSHTTIIPTKIRRKGEPIVANGKKLGINYKYSGFNFSNSPSYAGDFEEKISSLLEVLLPHKDEIKRLQSFCDVGLGAYWQSYYGNSSLGGFSLNRRIISMLNKMELDIDFDLYTGGIPFGE